MQTMNDSRSNASDDADNVITNQVEENNTGDVVEASVSVEEEGEEDEEGEESGSSEDDDDDDDGSTEDYGSDSTEEYDEDDEQEEGDEGVEDDTQEMDSDSSSSGAETERCPICLAKLRDQDIGAPETCDHSFCLECIIEWSKNVNTCPVDRQVFNLIMARQSFDGVIYKRIPVKDNTLVLDDAVVDDITECEQCGRADHEDRMLLCDSCNLGYHMYCLTPALDRVPRGMWYCPVCAPNMGTAEQEMVISSEEDEVIQPTRTRRNRFEDEDRIQIGRTLVRERVLRVITRVRRSTRVIESDSESEYEAATDQPETSTQPGTRRKRKSTRRKSGVRKKRRKTTRRKKRKTTTKTKSTSKTGKKTKRKGRRTRRKAKKGSRSARTKRLTPKSVKTRIADHLGLKSPPIGRSIPTLKGCRERNSFLQRSDIGATSLNIMGDRNEMIHFSDQSDDDVEIGHHGVAMAARASIHRIGPNINLKRARTLSIPSPKHRTTFDVLGSIMDGQTFLMTASDRITIARDGSLKMPARVCNGFSVRGDRPSDGVGAQDGGEDDHKDDKPREDSTGDNDVSSSQTHSHDAGETTGEQDNGCNSTTDAAGESDPVVGGAAVVPDIKQSASPIQEDDDDGGEEEDKDKKTCKLFEPEVQASDSLLPKSGSPNIKDQSAIEPMEEQTGCVGSNDVSSSPTETTEQQQSTCESPQDTANQSHESCSPKQEEMTNLEQTCVDNKIAQNKAIDREILKVSSPLDSPVPSYLYSPEVATISEEAVEDSVLEMEDIAKSDVVEEGGTPLVDERMASGGGTPVEDEQLPLDDRSGTPVVDEINDDDVNQDTEAIDEEQDVMIENRATDNIHIVPFSELPRIPKIKKKSAETLRLEAEDDSNNSHTSVLERPYLVDKQDSYPKWDKAKRDKNERKRKSEDRDETGSREDYDKRSHYRDRFKDRDDSTEDSGSRSRHKRRSRSRSRDRDRDRNRDRGYDRDRRRRSRSRDRPRKRSRSRSRERRSDSDRRRRERSRERSRRTRSKSRSPRRREREDVMQNRRKEVEESESGSSKRFKLKRNFYNDFKDRNEDYGYDEPGVDGETNKPDPFLQQDRPERSKGSEQINSFVSQVDANDNKSKSRGDPRKDDISRPGNRIPSLADVNDRLLRRFSPERDNIPALDRRTTALINRPPSPPMSELETLQEDRPSSGPPPGGPLPRGPPPGGLNPGLFQKPPLFKIPDGPPPRLRMRDNIQGLSMDDIAYDPSHPTEPEISPPSIQELFELKQLGGPGPPPPHIGRHSPLQPRMPFADIMRPHRGPLLADPALQREPPPHFVTIPDNLRQVMPPLPGFNVLQTNIHPRNVRPPLLMNPQLIGPHHIGRLPRLAGPHQIGWQAVSHPNVIIHNRIPIQVSQNGMPIHPNGPEAFLHPPPRLDHPSSQSVVDNLATPPPPIPPKALEEMQQISQLLNAQAQLAHIASKNEPVVHFREPPPPFTNSDTIFSPPIIQSRPIGEIKSVTFEEKMEVIDMDVASPSSDEVAVSFSPPMRDLGDIDLQGVHKGKHLNIMLDLSRQIHDHNKGDDRMPRSAVELDSSEKYMKKLNHQERVVEEVKLAIKPHYSKGKVDKVEYKEILRKAVPKICHSKSGDINPEKIRNYIDQYVEKVRLARKHSGKSKHS